MQFFLKSLLHNVFRVIPFQPDKIFVTLHIFSKGVQMKKIMLAGVLFGAAVAQAGVMDAVRHCPLPQDLRVASAVGVTAGLLAQHQRGKELVNAVEKRSPFGLEVWGAAGALAACKIENPTVRQVGAGVAAAVVSYRALPLLWSKVSSKKSAAPSVALPAES